MPYAREEVEAALATYVELRERIEQGDATWLDLAGMFTDDIVYIDPAWGRVEGIEPVKEFLVDSMVGLEDWKFPIELTAVDGDDVVVKWTQIIPGGRSQTGWSRMVYAGDGKFSYEEDLLNMVHVNEDLRASGWQPPDGFNMPPRTPNRDCSIPSR